VVAGTEDQRDRVLLVRGGAAQLHLLRGHPLGGRRLRGHCRALPTFVAFWLVFTWSPLPLPSPKVFDPYLVVSRMGWSSSALGTIVGMATPLSCSRTCSR